MFLSGFRAWTIDHEVVAEIHSRRDQWVGDSFCIPSRRRLIDVDHKCDGTCRRQRSSGRCELVRKAVWPPSRENEAMGIFLVRRGRRSEPGCSIFRNTGVLTVNAGRVTKEMTAILSIFVTKPGIPI